MAAGLNLTQQIVGELGVRFLKLDKRSLSLIFRFYHRGSKNLSLPEKMCPVTNGVALKLVPPKDS